MDKKNFDEVRADEIVVGDKIILVLHEYGPLSVVTAEVYEILDEEWPWLQINKRKGFGVDCMASTILYRMKKP